MTYLTIFRKKIRMCARFGHLDPAHYTPSVIGNLRQWYYCRRCGETIEIATRRAVSP